VLQLDRRLGVVVAAANVRALEHNVETQGVQAGYLECPGLRHAKRVVIG
jgi:hypothetical protein